MNGICAIDGCGGSIRGRGYCQKHYRRLVKNGHPLALMKRENGTGTLTVEGYWVHTINRRIVMQHVLIAEKALGKRLPKGAVVHHVDGCGWNNEPSNLVICPNAAYHKLLHQRTDALNACGNVNWRKCPFCKQWDDPANMVKEKRAHAHRACRRDYLRKWRAERVSV